jgi:hypothetical protein
VTGAAVVDVVAPPDTPLRVVLPALSSSGATRFGLLEADGVVDVGLADGRTEGLVLAEDARGLVTFYSTSGDEGTMGQPAYRGDLAGGARVFASIAARHAGGLLILELDAGLPFRVLGDAAKAAKAAGFEKIAIELP